MEEENEMEDEYEVEKILAKKIVGDRVCVI